MCFVDRISVLKGDNLLAFGQSGTNLFRCLHMIGEFWTGQRLCLQDSDIFALKFEENLVSFLKARPISNIECNWQTKQLFLRQSHPLHHSIILSLCHKALQRTEGTMNETPHIT